MMNTSQYQTARKSRDSRYDGVFFVGVNSTGIFCRPICPAPLPKEKNVSYFRSAAEAVEAGLRPCKRCRPELALDMAHWHISEQLLRVAVQRIHSGYLDHHSLDELAADLGITSRHLRRLFTDSLGASPLKIDLARRLLMARRLLLETPMKVTDIALTSGFNSVRRFNDAFRRFYQYPPRELRKATETSDTSKELTLTLSYRPPLDWRALLGFYRERAMSPLEEIHGDTYLRSFRTSSGYSYYRLSPIKGKHQLRLELGNCQTVLLPELITRVRRQFDLDSDILTIHEHLSNCPILKPVIERHPGLRLPGSFEPFETAVRAVIGQQISVRGCTTILNRVIARTQQHFNHPESGFPTPLELLELPLDNIGMTQSRIDTLRRLSKAIIDGQLSFSDSIHPEQLNEQLLRIKGIGPWTADYIAFRGMGFIDCMPFGDLGIRKALKTLRTDAEIMTDKLPSEAAIKNYSELWQPFRGYAALLLWQSLTDETHQDA